MAYVVKAVIIDSYKIELFNTGFVAVYHTADMVKNSEGRPVWDFSQIKMYDYFYNKTNEFEKFVKSF